MKMTRYRHDTLTGPEFVRELTALKMSEAEFSKLTGVRSRTIADWQSGDGPPYWVRLLLQMLRVDAQREQAHRISETHLMSEEEYRSLRESAA